MAYVEIEKFETWAWFLALLLRDIGSHEEKGWAFISDRQKGLLEAISKQAPQAEHRICLRHMYNNFKGRYKGQQLKNLFWKAASTYNVRQHLRVMREIQRISPKRSINKLRLETDDYVDDCFKKERYLRVYSHMVNHVPGMHEYEESTLGIVNPPNVKTRLGRPKKKRMRDGNDRDENNNSRQRERNGAAATAQTEGTPTTGQPSANVPPADEHNENLGPSQIPSQTEVLMESFDFNVFSDFEIPSQTDVPIESVNLSDYFEVPQTATQASSSIPPRPRSRKQQTPQPRRIPNQASATPVTQRTESVTALERLKKRMQPSLPRPPKMPQVSTSTNSRPPKRPQASSSNTSRPSTFKRQCCTSSTSQNSTSVQGVGFLLNVYGLACVMLGGE
ncbi:hypothetical protein BUALT_Bualt09G0140400 [Buddleja alternifolia]|uniref:MULE transposase domain-containing protein n=1 Tax=Buddleja alternifolia TaxID=168488 RepID=A0AAV6XDF2_9LAMI|nr:hypothetical protein BUALT_Bualt09G0140400 [Buddleja alternifolia]